MVCTSSSVISCRDWKRPLVSGNVIVTGPGIEIEDRTRIRRVAILTDHILMIDRRQLALVLEFTEAAFLQGNRAEAEIALGTDEALDRDRDSLRCGCLAGCHAQSFSRLITAPLEEAAARRRSARALAPRS